MTRDELVKQLIGYSERSDQPELLRAAASEIDRLAGIIDQTARHLATNPHNGAMVSKTLRAALEYPSN